MPTIKQLAALEILDSRGRPTLLATCTLDDGATASASTPSGASTGRHEAHELRDGDPNRYSGLGCQKAAANIHGPISEALLNGSFESQPDLDRRLLPRLTVNLFSGGKHAGGQIPIQDLLIIPHSTTIADSLAMCHAVYQSASKLIQQKYQSRPLVADEGGLAPNFPSSGAMIEDAI